MNTDQIMKLCNQVREAAYDKTPDRRTTGTRPMVGAVLERFINTEAQRTQSLVFFVP